MLQGLLWWEGEELSKRKERNVATGISTATLGRNEVKYNDKM